MLCRDFSWEPAPWDQVAGIGELKALFLKGSWVGCKQMYAFVIFPFWQCYQLSSICHSSISSGAKTVASIWPKKMWTSETVHGLLLAGNWIVQMSTMNGRLFNISRFWASTTAPTTSAEGLVFERLLGWMQANVCLCYFPILAMLPTFKHLPFFKIVWS